MPATGMPPLPPALVWHEIGRPSPGEAQNWVAWVSPLGDGGDALYRSLVFADGAIVVTVELHSRGVSGTRTIHRGRCGWPRDPEQTAERVRLLLGAADRAAARVLEVCRSDGAGAAAGRGEPLSRRVPDDAPQGGGPERDVPAARHERGNRTRGHAHLPREREGRSEGCAADEPREGACREAATAA